MKIPDFMITIKSRSPIQIGMRTFKTWIAASVTAMLALTFLIGNPFYALMGSVLSMQTTVSNSFITGRDRVIGTAIGALVGFVFAYFNINTPWFVPIAIVVVIVICRALSIEHAIPITVTLCLLIMFNPNREEGFFIYTFLRLLDTAVGVIVGSVVNRFVAPPNHLKFIHRELVALNKLVKRSRNDDDFLFKFKEIIVNMGFHHENYITDEKYDNHDFSNESLRKMVEACEELYFHFKYSKHDDLVISDYHTTSIAETLELLEVAVKTIKGAI